jgi:hypothetical protein
VEAIWHHVEGNVTATIASAKVLTLTDSHLQEALSLGNASAWFADHGYPVYMLGLPTAESGFGERLVDNFHPHAKVVILDASPYFTGELGHYERPIFEDPKASLQAVLDLKNFQTLHERFCDVLPAACGHNFAYFRARLDGHWIFPARSNSIWIGLNDIPNDIHRFPTGQEPNVHRTLYPEYLASARRLVEKLNMPMDCIVITHVPAEEDLGDLAQYIGQSLGLTVIVPVVPNLSTFDRAHLTPESSLRWTRAFLLQLDPILRRCAGGGAMSATNVISH